MFGWFWGHGTKGAALYPYSCRLGATRKSGALGQIRTHAPQQNASKSDRTILRNKAAQQALDALRSLAL